MQAFTLSAPAGFDLATAVCSYGWILLAPNRWIRTAHKLEKPAFERPLHTRSGDVVAVRVCQPRKRSLQLDFDPAVTAEEAAALASQVRRMLRLSEEDTHAVEQFQAKHDQAQREGFGRLFRAPTVWEDAVKCILLCNCGWSRTVTMNAALCEKVGGGAFPTAAQIAALDSAELQAECGLGYRSRSIAKLALQVSSGELDLEALEDRSISDEALLKRLCCLPGLGPFSATNMLQLLGRYALIACDSETVRHLKAHRQLSDCSSRNVLHLAGEVYKAYSPYQFLAYWHELWRSYELLLGPFADLDPALYHSFTGSNMRKHDQSTRPQKRRRA